MLFTRWRFLRLRWSLQRLYNGCPCSLSSLCVSVELGVAYKLEMFYRYKYIYIVCIICTIELLLRFKVYSKYQTKRIASTNILLVGSSASAIQIWLMIAHLQSNSERSFLGSLMLSHLLIVPKVVMGLTLAVWIWMVCRLENYLCVLSIVFLLLWDNKRPILLFCIHLYRLWEWCNKSIRVSYLSHTT